MQIGRKQIQFLVVLTFGVLIVGAAFHIQSNPTQRNLGVGDEKQLSVAVEKSTPNQSTNIEERTERYSTNSDPEVVVTLDFSYITSEYLQDNWKQELGCFQSDQDNEIGCKYQDPDARSLEEAMWMAKSGFPPARVLDELDKLEHEALADITNHTNDSITQSAYMYLERVFGTPRDEWPVTPRPEGG